VILMSPGTPRGRTVHRVVRLTAGLAVLAGLLAGCSADGSLPALAPAAPGGGGSGPALSPTGVFNGDLPNGTVPSSLAPAAFYRVPSPLPAAPAGTLIRTQQISSPGGIPTGAHTYRVLYHSRSLTGADIAVSGLVIVPATAPPRGGYPILAWAHGTTGIADQCAPSRSNQVFIPYAAQLLARGFVIAATDYEGLGTAGIHPYLVGTSEARSVLDGARAARALVGARTSGTVVVMGHSQGGQAALFAGEIAPIYAPDLFVAGIVAIAPVGSVADFVPANPPDTPVAAQTFALMAVVAWAQYYPGVPLRSALTAYGARFEPVVDGACADRLGSALVNIPADRIFVNGWSTSGSMAVPILANEPGGAPSAAPILVAQGTADVLVPASGTERLVADRLCGTENDTVDFDEFAGSGHTSVLAAAQAPVLGWIGARLSGAHPVDTCGGPPNLLS
jgi:alpha-beta hydrolase superfamily lysophospholipase